MNQASLLQTFALANDGELVHVQDADRGARCACICPACGQPVVAKQGEVRIWHFAHAPGAECKAGAETALHLAAKEAIRRAGGFMLPAIVQASRHGTGSSAVLRPACWMDFQEVDLEAQVGSRRPDVVGRNDKSLHLIEIAVTHYVDHLKLRDLIATGHPAVEVDLGSCDREGWTWDQLRTEVVEGEQLKRWLHCPDLSELLQTASSSTPVSPAPHTTAPRLRYRRAGQILDLIHYPFGVVLWAPYNEAMVAEIKSIARHLGGRYQPKFRSWLFPDLASSALTDQVQRIGFQLAETR